MTSRPASKRPWDATSIFVVLGLHDPSIAHCVLTDGVLVLDADPLRRVDFTSDVLARYLDWAARNKVAFARQAIDGLAALPQASPDEFLADPRNLASALH